MFYALFSGCDFQPDVHKKFIIILVDLFKVSGRYAVVEVSGWSRQFPRQSHRAYIQYAKLST